MTCGCIGTGFRRCEEHHQYWDGGRQLSSVTHIIGSVWPVKVGEGPRPSVLENARERGVAVDSLVSDYINGTLVEIPAGTREDVVDLFTKVQTWWDAQGFKKAEAQVMLQAPDYAGTCDIIADDQLFDLKCAYSLHPKYRIQLGGYASMKNFDSIWTIHATKRLAEVAVAQYNVPEAINDWTTTYRWWKLTR